MIKTAILLLSASISVGALVWLGPIAWIVCFLLVLGTFLFSMQEGSQIKRKSAREPGQTGFGPTAFGSTYMANL